MKKKSITLGVVFCIFILCSLTYQPIVANESLDAKLEEKSVSYNNQLKKIDIKSIFSLLFNGIKKDTDCGCGADSKGIWPFPVICISLFLFWAYIERNEPLGYPWDDMFIEMIMAFGIIFNCRWAPYIFAEHYE